MTENQTPAEAVVIEFPKSSVVKKASKIVVVTGIITGGVLMALNYRAKAANGEFDLQSDAEELKTVEGTNE